MKVLAAPVIAMLAVGCSTGAHCQSTDAARYVNAQGIEIIQGRRAIARPVAQAATPPGAAVSFPARSPARAGGDVRLQIPAATQRSRDRDRLTILTQELANESRAFESKFKIMQTPALKAKLNEQEAERLQEVLLDHEKNIRALHAEIGRARGNG